MAFQPLLALHSPASGTCATERPRQLYHLGRTALCQRVPDRAVPVVVDDEAPRHGLRFEAHLAPPRAEADRVTEDLDPLERRVEDRHTFQDRRGQLGVDPYSGSHNE